MKELKKKPDTSSKPKKVRRKTVNSERDIKTKAPVKISGRRLKISAPEDITKKKENTIEPIVSLQEGKKNSGQTLIDPEEKKKILKARAKDLAEEQKQEVTGEGHLELVEFILWNPI
jgi:hypothetical protein